MDFIVLIVGAAVVVALGCIFSGCHHDYWNYELRAYQLETERLERLERVRAEAFGKPDMIDPEFSEL